MGRYKVIKHSVQPLQGIYLRLNGSDQLRQLCMTRTRKTDVRQAIMQGFKERSKLQLRKRVVSFLQLPTASVSGK